MDRNVIIDELKNYYDDVEFKAQIGYNYDNISENDLNAFFNNHCEKHKQIIHIKELHDKYNESLILVNTPDGYQDINDLYIKGPFDIYTITVGEHEISCSENHLIETDNGWKYAKDLKIGDIVNTKDGLKAVTNIGIRMEKEVTYDFEVLHENHRYWGGNGISSHNTGKSYLACSCVREAQKMGVTCIYMDSEGALDSKFVSRLGVDPSKLIIKQVTTISETSQFIANILEQLQKQDEEYGRHNPVMFVLDSLGNLTSDKEMADTKDGNNKRDMTKAQEIKALFRVNATALARTQTTLLCVNHVYSAVGAYVPTNIGSGGCLLPNERIHTKNGIKEIQDIVVGDYVLSHDNQFHKVSKTWNFEKPTFTFTFDNNESITCSNTHKFLINCEHPELDSSWKTADELTESDEIYILTTEYRKLKIVKKSELSSSKKVIDLTVDDTHTYVSENGIINHNSGIKYNSSLTIELSVAKLEDKNNDAAAAKKQGSETAVKNGVLVTAKSVKSRFCRPYKVKFQIPFHAKPNSFLGLEAFMTWENSGVCRGTMITEKDYNKMTDAQKAKIYTFDYNGETKYCEPKDTARGIVVKHLGCAVPITEFFTEKVFTQEFLEYLNENVIHPMFDLPSQDSFEDVKEIEDMITTGDQIDSED